MSLILRCELFSSYILSRRWNIMKPERFFIKIRYSPEVVFVLRIWWVRVSQGPAAKKWFCRTSVATVPQLVYQFVVSHVTRRSTQFSQAR